MAETGRLMPSLPPPSPELTALLERARNHVMTPAEKSAQRRSWCIGEMMLEHPEMTRDDAITLYEKVIGS